MGNSEKENFKMCSETFNIAVAMVFFLKKKKEKDLILTCC